MIIFWMTIVIPVTLLRHRSVRGQHGTPVRPKIAQDTIRENGDIGFPRKGKDAKGKEQDVDIKLLQQKKLQAEIRRLVNILNL